MVSRHICVTIVVRPRKETACLSARHSEAHTVVWPSIKQMSRPAPNERTYCYCGHFICGMCFLSSRRPPEWRMPLQTVDRHTGFCGHSLLRLFLYSVGPLLIGKLLGGRRTHRRMLRALIFPSFCFFVGFAIMLCVSNQHTSLSSF